MTAPTMASVTSVDASVEMLARAVFVALVVALVVLFIVASPPSDFAIPQNDAQVIGD